MAGRDGPVHPFKPPAPQRPKPRLRRKVDDDPLLPFLPHVMATWCAADELRPGRLPPVRTNYPIVSAQALWALYPSSRELALKVRVLID